MTFLIIVALIIVFIVAYKPKKKQANYYLLHPELNRTVEYSASATTSDSLVHFVYKNRSVYLRRKDGKTLSGNLENLNTSFCYVKTKVYYSTTHIFTCCVKHGGRKFYFSNSGGLFTKEAIWDILDILSKSGTVSGQGDINEYKSYCELKGALKDTVKSFLGKPTDSNPDLVGAIKNYGKAFVGITPDENSSYGFSQSQNLLSGNTLPHENDVSSRLRDAKSLLDAGIVDKEEFERMKRNILNS